MAEKEKTVDDVFFGKVLAFLAPGFIGFVGLSYHLPTAKAWLDAAQDSEQTVGVFLFAVLASLVTGVIISGLRDIAADPLIRSGFLIPALKIEMPVTDVSKLLGENKLYAYQQAVEAFYRYYQFYSNTAVALLLLSISRVLAQSPPPWPSWWRVGIITILVLLTISAYKSLRSFAKSIGSLFPSTERSGQ
jgi:hypothetical protein